MRLLIIASDSSGRVSLASDRVFADAMDATRELGRLFGEGAVDTSAAFYTVDMDAAVPVIVLQQPSANGSTIEELVEEPYASEILEAVDEEPVAAEAVETAGDAPAEETPAEQAEAQGGQWPWDLPVIPEEGTADEVPEAPVEEEPAAEEGAFLIVEDVQPDEPMAEPAEAVEEIVVEEQVVEEQVVEEAPAEEVPAEDPSELEPVEAAVELAEAAEDPEADALLAEAVALTEELAAETPETVAEPQSVLDASAVKETEAEAPERVYEPGALNMNEYTCDDCVYVNTCPNRDQKKPAECGSFQWKSSA